jgi:arylsulfatase
VPAAEKDEWDQRMAVYAAMIDCLDQGVGRVLDAVRKTGAEENTLVFFLSDNGASAEFLDTWPNPARGHKPGSVVGTRESHRCIEVGWANAANTPFREHKMWVHEGGISTPLIARWPAGIKARGTLTSAVGHVIDFMPTCLELAGKEYPRQFAGKDLTPLAGRTLVPVLKGKAAPERTLFWEHEGNRAVRAGDWKLVAEFKKDWELFDMKSGRTETRNLASSEPGRVKALAALWQEWADKVGVVPWKDLPGGSYKPTAGYRRKSEPPVGQE